MLITRLKEARRRAGLTQEKLGILAGLDEASAIQELTSMKRGSTHQILRRWAILQKY